jgi:hypothetical protein
MDDGAFVDVVDGGPDALLEKGLKEQIGAHESSPTLDLPCDVVFSAGQRPTEVVGPLLEVEAAALQADFWKARDAHHPCIPASAVSPLMDQHEGV